jgi:DNA-directed RNA polymerase subunit H (RpoH/RPB5)
MKINELISNFEIFTTNEEQKLLERLKDPIKLANLTDREQCVAEAMIRKSLLKKIGFNDPTVVANEKPKI